MSRQPRPNLSAIINGPTQAPASPVDVPQPIETESVAPIPIAPKPKAVPAAKVIAQPEGKGAIKQRTKQLTLYLEDPEYDQLRELAFIERKKMHPLLLEALDLLFKKRGLKSLAQLGRKDAA